jgi:hypothetical protein
MRTSLAALLLAGALVGACADRVAPSASPSGSIAVAPGTPSPSSASVPPTDSAPPSDPGPTSTSPPAPPTPTPTPVATPTPTPTPAPPLGAFPQSWTGTWADPVTGGSGSIEFTLIERGTGFGGSIAMDGTACLSNAVVSGTYDGRDIEFSVALRGVEVHFTGTGDEAAMAGSFVTDCDAMDGTWQVSRSDR